MLVLLWCLNAWDLEILPPGALSSFLNLQFQFVDALLDVLRDGRNPLELFEVFNGFVQMPGGLFGAVESAVDAFEQEVILGVLAGVIGIRFGFGIVALVPAFAGREKKIFGIGIILAVLQINLGERVKQVRRVGIVF